MIFSNKKIQLWNSFWSPKKFEFFQPPQKKLSREQKILCKKDFFYNMKLLFSVCWWADLRYFLMVGFCSVKFWIKIERERKF